MGTKEAIQNNLAKLMRENGVRNVDLARSIGVSKAAVTNWLNGRNSIDMDIVPKICSFFGVSVDEFLDVGSRPVLNADERELVECFRAMSPRFQNLLLENARAYADNGQAKNNQVEAV